MERFLSDYSICNLKSVLCIMFTNWSIYPPNEAFHSFLRKYTGTKTSIFSSTEISRSSLFLTHGRSNRSIMEISRIKTKGMEELRRICGDSDNKHGGKLKKKKEMAVWKEKQKFNIGYISRKEAIFNFRWVFWCKEECLLCQYPVSCLYKVNYRIHGF